MKMPNVTSQNDILDMVTAFQASRILLTAYELGIFSILGSAAKTSAEAARALRLDKRAADRLMNALCAVGLLEKKGENFANTAIASRYLVKESRDHMAMLAHYVNLWDSWSTLTEAVRRGRAVGSRDVGKRETEWLTAFIGAMHWRAGQQAPAVIALLDLGGVSRILDVGGGSGAYSMAFARAKVGLKATVFDLPNVIKLAKNYIKEEGLSDRIETRAGDYNFDDLGKGFDLAFLSAIIHSNSAEENRKLIRRAAGALNPGGRLVVQDFIMDEDRATPAFGAIFALNMLVGTVSGDTYTESEIRAWMNEAGLADIVRKNTPFDASLIIGRKA